MAESAAFKNLRQKRLRYVESARENNFEEGLKSLLSELYPDNAHFIYELLQNAEDALATTVKFTLEADRLTVSHDGKRPFSIADIESITGIGQSTKKDDPTQIGKFGVGFKAVFAYTTRPEVRSGAHSFAINDLFVPTAIDGTAQPKLTTFTFPFDREEKPVDTARAEVERGLLSLDEKTLLFLDHISEITYELPDGTVGIIEREPVDSRIVAIRRPEGDHFIESHWLRLSGPASVDGPTPSALTVAAAFKVELADDPRRKKAKEAAGRDEAPRRSIVPVHPGDVSIYFPAVKESSGLRFHIHAPFASTVARDSVRDDPGNVRLVGDIARLIADALPGLCEEGLIDESFLAALPNDDDQIGHPYGQIRDAITEAFNDLEITPVRGTGAAFAAARTLVASPSELRNWLDPADLPTLFDFASIAPAVNPRWIRPYDGRAGKFLAGLDPIEFGWRELNQALSAAKSADEILADADELYDGADKVTPNAWFAWLAEKTDDSLLRLYQLIGSGVRHGLLYGLDDVPIVRLRKRDGVRHVRGSKTFLPPGRSDQVQSRVPTNLAYFDDDEDPTRSANLTAFYRAVATKRWDESARAEQRLEAYQDRNRAIPDGDGLTQHLEDIRAFIRYKAKEGVVAHWKLASTPMFLAEQSQGGQRWVTAGETYVDLPFKATGLSALYPRVPMFWTSGSRVGEYAYDSEPYALAGIYFEIDGVVDFVGSLGAKTGIEITQAAAWRNAEFSWSWDNRETSKGQRSDWTIDRLDDIIETGDHDLLRALWSTVVAADASKAMAVYQANASAQSHHMASQLARTLTSTPWVLTRDGELKRPREVSVEELPDDWPAPLWTSLAYKLEFAADAIRQRADTVHQLQKQEAATAFLREEGLEEDSIDFLRRVKEAGLGLRDLEAVVRDHKAKSQFPDGPSEDPGRRAAVAALEAASAPEYSTAMRERSVVDGQAQASAESRAYLRAQYTSAGEMHCQACRKPLPFKMKDGSWYFEAVKLVGGRKQVHKANAIALCPLCAALYKHARGTRNEAILNELESTAIDAGQGVVEIPVVLDGKRVKLGFTGKHAIDIKAALAVAGDERSEAD